jgi:2,4-dienoyl-CoA reductase-like NADH-dependent reductase (Old Yellow Enzyme family)
MTDARLFSPIELREVRLRNRIVVSPMLTYSATNGHINDFHLMHLGKFAAGGAGLVFMESTKIDPRGCTTPRDTGLWKDEFIAPLKRVTDLIKSYGAVPGIQLSHSGRKGRNSLPWEGRAPLANWPGVDHGEEWELIGPSPIAHSERYIVPREMTRADIREIAEAWGRGAARAQQAGFDAVEIHGAHGYLIHQFLSAQANHRSDEYGGSLANRMRFAAEVANQVRQHWPKEKPLFFRISSVDEVGWGIEDSIALAKVLKANGVDVIDCSGGGMSEKSSTEFSTGYGYQVNYAEQIRRGADVMTMAVGLIIHADQADEIVQSGRADLIAVGREFLHNPNWALDAAQKLNVAAPFAHVPPAYGYWLEKRARSAGDMRPSTWQRGIGGETNKVAD